MKIQGRSAIGTRAFASIILFLVFVSPLANLASSQENTFILAASPISSTRSQAGKATVTLTVTPVGTFNQTVYFWPANVTGLPNGTNVLFQPQQVTPPANVTMTFTISVYTPLGSYNVTAYAISGSINQSVPIQLTIVEDHISPTTSLTIDGVAEPDGKYRSDVLVTLLAEDNVNGSGIAETAYNINNSSWIHYSEPFPVNLDGSFTIQYNSTDYAGNVEQTKTRKIIIEKPIKINSDAVYTNSPAVNLALSAELVTLGVINMSFSNNNINWTEWEAYAETKDWNLSDGEGLKTIYVKFSNETHVSSAYFDTITLVTTPPNTTVSLVGTMGDNDWYVSDVQIEFQVDSTALLNETWCRVDNGTWTKYDQPINITTEGQTSIEFYSTDKAGNIEETKNITIKVDKTTPTIEVTSPEEGRNYKFNKPITVAFEATDEISGLENATATLDGLPVQNGSIHSHLSLANHTMSVRAVDFAGNTATKTVTFRVVKQTGGGGDDDGDEGGPTTQTRDDLIEKVDALIDEVEKGPINNKGIVQSLIAKLKACEQKISKGQFKTAMNILNAFINHVEAQSGKHIEDEDFALELIDEANHLKDDLNGAT